MERHALSGRSLLQAIATVLGTVTLDWTMNGRTVYARIGRRF
jgi:hypothetical protein